MSWTLINVTDDELYALKMMSRGRARFLIDENVDPEVTQYLKSKKYNVKDIKGVGHQALDDENVLNLALQERRLLITHDEDFLNDRKHSFHKNPGVIIIPSNDGQFDTLVRGVIHIEQIFAPYWETCIGAKIAIRKDSTFTIRQRHFDTNAIETSKYMLKNGKAYLWED